MTRVSHGELAAAETNFDGWWQARQSSVGSGPRFGYAQAVKLAAYKYHKEGSDRDAALEHFDRLVIGRLRDPARIYSSRLQLESYMDWAEESAVIVADQRVRIDLPISDGIRLGGEISRVDILPNGYRAILLNARCADEPGSLRFPLIQVAIANRYQREADDVEVGCQGLDGRGLVSTRFGAAERVAALERMARLARRIEDRQRR